VIGIFCDEHMGQQSRSGEATLTFHPRIISPKPATNPVGKTTRLRGFSHSAKSFVYAADGSVATDLSTVTPNYEGGGKGISSFAR